MTPIGGPHLPTKPGNLTMGWDVPEVPSTPQPTSPSQLAAKAAQGPQVAQKPGALTMGWDVPDQPGPKAPPQQPGALTMGWEVPPEQQPAPGPKAPQQPGALTMGWDVPDQPAGESQGPRVPQQPGALTMGWEVPDAPAQEQAPVSPSSLAASAKPDPSAKSTLLGMMPIRDDVGVPTFSAPHRVAQPLPVSAPSSSVEISPLLHQASPAGPHQAIQAGDSAYTPQAAPAAPYSPVPTEKVRTGTNTENLDKPPRNMLPIYAAIGLVVIAAIVIAIVLFTQ